MISRIAPVTMTDKQKAIWNHAIENAPVELLSLLDGQILSIWVVAADTHHEAMLNIKKYGKTVMSKKNGTVIKSPYMAIMDRQAEIMLMAARELGFLPTKRYMDRSELPSGTPGTEAG